MDKEEWIRIYHAKDGTWDKDDLIDEAYNIITKPIKTNYDRIINMTVDQMAEMLLEEVEAPLSGEMYYMTPDEELYSQKEDGAKVNAINHIIQWLLQPIC